MIQSIHLSVHLMQGPGSTSSLNPPRSNCVLHLGILKPSLASVVMFSKTLRVQLGVRYQLDTHQKRKVSRYNIKTNVCTSSDQLTQQSNS